MMISIRCFLCDQLYHLHLHSAMFVYEPLISIDMCAADDWFLDKMDAGMCCVMSCDDVMWHENLSQLADHDRTMSP